MLKPPMLPCPPARRLVCLSAALLCCRCALADFYVPDTTTATIRSVDASGNAGIFADHLPATIHKIAVDDQGNLFAQQEIGAGKSRIIKIKPGVGLSTIADNLDPPARMAVGPEGALYLASGDKILKLDDRGNAQIWATLSGGESPRFLAFDRSGNLYAAAESGEISKIAPGGAATHFAHSSRIPTSMAFDRAGTLYVSAAPTACIIQRITPDGKVSVFATVPHFVQGIAFDANNVLHYVSHKGELCRLTAAGIEEVARNLGNTQSLAYMPESTSGKIAWHVPAGGAVVVLLLSIWLWWRQARRDKFMGAAA